MVTANDKIALQAAKEWLLAKHCTLWQNWDLLQEESLEEAAQFVVDVTDQFGEFFVTRVMEGAAYSGSTRSFDVVG